MASRDLAGLLTGISGTQRPNPNQGSDAWRMAFGAQQAQNLGNAVGNIPTMFGEARNVNPQEAIQIGMGKLDQGDIEHLKTLARMQQMRDDLEGAARTAAKIQAMQAAGPAAAKEERRYQEELALRGREVTAKEITALKKSGANIPALIQEFNFAEADGFEGGFMAFIAAKRSPLVSTVVTPKQKREGERLKLQSNLYETTRELMPAAQKNLGTANGILGVVEKGTPTGQAGSLVADFATYIQSVAEVTGLKIPDAVANATANNATMKRYAGEALMPFIEQQGRGFTDTEREYFLKNVIAGYDQPWQFNDAYGTVLKSKSLSEIEKNNFAFTVSRSDKLLEKAPQNLWAEYEQQVPRLKIGTKRRGGVEYEGAIVIQDNENLSQYWTEKSPKGFKVANGAKPIIEYSWGDLKEISKSRNQSVRELLVDFSRGGDLIGGIY
jgi:hypothetical protein